MLATVNGGVIQNIEGLEIEILSHNFHNPYCDIVCTYFTNENGNKVELTYYKYIDKYNNADGTIRSGNEVYMFKNADELQHYKSYNYRNGMNLPSKYIDLANLLKNIHSKIDFNQYQVSH
jgi:hypothetical protein